MIKKIYSIRRFLLLSLFAAMALTTLITSLGNFYLDNKDITEHLDNLLRHAAQSFRSILSNDFLHKNFLELQQNINQNGQTNFIPTRFGGLFVSKYPIPFRYEFQIWSPTGKLLLHSKNAPITPLSDKVKGFASISIGNDQWRSYTETDAETKIRFIVAEKHLLRNILLHEIAVDDFYILLAIYPFAGLLIWFIVGKALGSINRVTEEVKHRLPNYLAPVDSTFAPDEIIPLVRELNKLFLRLQQAFDREKRFAADAAHELKTPLAAIKTQAQVGLKSEDDHERTEILQKIICASDRLTHIVQQLLTMSRIVPESGIVEELFPIDLAAIASEIIAQLVPSAIEKDIDIEMIATDHCYIKGNITAITILIRNLVDNAIRYCPEHCHIKIFISTDSKHVILKVADNGPGIPSELHRRVFERFYRVLGNHSPGSGLGLAIVQQIAELHNASIQLNKPDHGTGLIVSVFFPKTTGATPLHEKIT